MKDAEDKPGGRKGSNKIRSHRSNPIDAFKSSSGKNSTRGNTSRMLASRIVPHLDPLSIRGAASRPPTTPARNRRNAISATGVNGTTSSGMLDVLRGLVQKRYNAEARFLNLEDIEHDEILVKCTVSRSTGSKAAIQEMAVIMKLASKLEPTPTTISLANNNFRNGLYLQTIHRYLPKLANLSLANNALRDFNQLEFISSKKGKLIHLRELVLTGNPLRENLVKANNLSKYKREVTRLCTALEMLDSEAVPKIAFDSQPEASTSAVPIPDKELATTFPFAMGPSFITGVDPGVVSNFLTRYFQFFDNQRASLRDVYDPNATFSFCINTDRPERAGALRMHMKPNQKALSHNAWISVGTRSLARYHENVKNLYIGQDHVISSIDRLPQTRHDITGPADKFILDAFPIPLGTSTGLLLTVHGEFTELSVEAIRSFDRSYVLGPAPEGSAARASGWDIVILSDQLTIRGWSSSDSWKPGRLSVQAGELQLPDAQQKQLDAIPEPQKTMVYEVCKRTNLTVKFAVDCLGGNKWEVGPAVANFNAVKGTLPPDAFLPAV